MRCAILALVATLWAFAAVAENAPAHLAGLGTITFPTSETGPAQERFVRGVTILHSFGWKQARTEFQPLRKPRRISPWRTGASRCATTTR